MKFQSANPPRSPHTRRTSIGFTMIEVMVALMIIGFVGALSAGRIHTLMLKGRMARAATSVQGDLEAAFNLAARNRAPVRIAWNSSKMQMGVTDRAGTTFYRRTPLGSDYGLVASNVAFSKSPLEVYPNGLAEDTLKIVLTIESQTKSIRVSRAGMVRIE